MPRRYVTRPPRPLVAADAVPLESRSRRAPAPRRAPRRAQPTVATIPRAGLALARPTGAAARLRTRCGPPRATPRAGDSTVPGEWPGRTAHRPRARDRATP